MNTQTSVNGEQQFDVQNVEQVVDQAEETQMEKQPTHQNTQGDIEEGEQPEARPSVVEEEEVENNNWKLYVGFGAMILALIALLMTIVFTSSSEPEKTDADVQVGPMVPVTENAEMITMAGTTAAAVGPIVNPTYDVNEGYQPADATVENMDDVSAVEAETKKSLKDRLCGDCGADGSLKKTACVAGGILGAGAAVYGTMSACACCGVTPCIEAASCGEAQPMLNGMNGSEYLCGEEAKVCCSTGTCCGSGLENSLCCGGSGLENGAVSGGCCTDPQGNCSCFACGADSPFGGAVCCAPNTCGDGQTCCEITTLTCGVCACAGTACAASGGR